MKPTCLVAGLFNYDTIVTRETADAPERVVSQEVGGTGGVVSKLMASLGWTTMPVCRFDDSEEGRLLRNGLAAYGCDMRYVTNLPDGGTTNWASATSSIAAWRTFAIIDCIIAALGFLKL